MVLGSRKSWVLLACAVFLLALASSCSGFFVDPQLTSITVSPPSPSLLKGGTQQFSASGVFDNGQTKTLSDITWTSSNLQVVTISSTGLATAVATGSATISATSGGITGSTTVSVVSSPLNSIQISPQNPSISLSSQPTQQFSAVGTFNDGTTKDVTSSVTWTSSNTAVATITTSGLAQGVASGSTTITASSGTVTASTTLQVNR
ncbi:MAG TPA: Ig-like domain-containing protein [Terriglobales bacterium]|nr:Ig-like domain-containing protein [Terriglobales bacterium]